MGFPRDLGKSECLMTIEITWDIDRVEAMFEMESVMRNKNVVIFNGMYTLTFSDAGQARSFMEFIKDKYMEGATYLYLINNSYGVFRSPHDFPENWIVKAFNVDK